jgi:uncharacterized membrane protein (DUF106 family)
MILEGEHHLDQARAHVTACEMKATKLKKELRKATRRGNAAEIQQLEIQLVHAENSFLQAQNEGLWNIIWFINTVRYLWISVTNAVINTNINFNCEKHTFIGL